MKTESPWSVAQPPAFPRLKHPIETDVLIIGGGITGVTAAYLLSKVGCSVVLVEKTRLCKGETNNTTAHISYPTDLRLNQLVSKFGRNHAEAVWDACFASAEQIRKNVCAEEIACDFRHVPGYLYAAADANQAKEIEKLKEDVRLATEMGFDAEYIESCPLAHQPAVRFSNLFKFEPARYVLHLPQAAQEHGCQIYENCEAGEFDGEARHVQCGGHRISYQHVFIATHVPLQGTAGTLDAALLQTKLAGYSTYALKADLPMGNLPEALWWDTANPYFYLRIDAGSQGIHVIAGGEDHKTGQETATKDRYAALERQLEDMLPPAEITHRWSGQVIETVDGLPYIGEYNGQFIATGFTGTGITYGTLAAMMFRDHVIGVANPWKDLFRVDRKEFSSTWDYLKENKDYPYYLAKSLFIGSKEDPRELASGEGAILRHQGRKVAASRDSDGNLTLLSAICPHMGCVVAWNSADKTWDCPCHGSRFTGQGKVIAGPAESPLEKIKS
ncbi:FAD-dependent oxidoreductase [Prosthecobacter sp. SYSU 5D2]|uniref:FAD-dependent oxidoreductase n=1 Tax=Prosthecobacter sp. SYSU 5D2 TaxID=3134134 RepID=UPI0031FE8ECC